MKHILLILSILTLSVLIPLKSYSQGNIQRTDTIVINEYQARNILLDKAKLKFLEKNSKQDSLHIAQLEKKVKDYKESEDGYNILLKIKEDRITTEKRKNKLILIGSGIIVGTVTYLYITK